MVFATIIAIFVIAGLCLISLSRHQKSATGELRLTGTQALVSSPLEPEGSIVVAGEVWRARSKTGQVLPEGSLVLIVGTQGHLLIVDRI